MDLIDYLKAFNRKERFYLVGMALGNSAFTLGAELRDRLRTKLGLDVPSDAFAAMDYHLDWIYASLELARRSGYPGPHSNVSKMIRAHQEDIDLLIAYQREATFHIVLLEAKGVTGWSNRQMRSKAERFGEIFGAAGDAFEGVVPHFAIASPKRPGKLAKDEWPLWMTPGGNVPWLEMPITPERLRVTRCTEGGVPSKVGDHWRVLPT